MVSLLLPLLLLLPQQAPVEADHYVVQTIREPADVVLEASGLLPLGVGRLLVATRRGQVWLVEHDPDPAVEEARFTLFAEGLQEPMGLLAVGNWIYTVQRGELSRMQDRDEAGHVDRIETVADAWDLSGNYHEYAFGPVRDREGNFWITLNKPFGDQPFGAVDWRGWAIRVTPEGTMIPTACGLRSPCGVEVSPWGDVFYTDNQGEWCGASKLSLLRPGDFHGHPHGIESCRRPDSPVPYPGMPPDGMLMPEVAEIMPTFRLPAIWFPYEKMGNSPSGLVWDTTSGAFGPFTGQVFVGDQHHSWVMRCFLELVDGHWQGACFRFREGLRSGVVRVAFGPDGSLYAGMTNRGWGSRGGASEGLQRIVYTGAPPFDVLEMHARRDGFTFTFTRPVDREAARTLAGYRGESYTYELHSAYGSDEMDKRTLAFPGARVAADGLSLTLEVAELRPGYVHEIHLDGVRAEDGTPLLHPEAYYTLIKLPRR